MLYLTPSFLVSDIILVLEMCNHLGLARQCPHQSPSVRSGELLRRLQLVLGAVHLGGCHVYRHHEILDESVHNYFVILVTYFKCVIEENVSWKNYYIIIACLKLRLCFFG